VPITRVQGSGKYQTDGTTGTVTYTAGLSNFGLRRLVVSPFVHYAEPVTDLITGVTVNGDAATKVASRTNPTNNPNQVEIWARIVATAGANSTAVTLGGAGATGGGHFLTGAAAEFSYSGQLVLVGTGTADGNDNAPTIARPSGVQPGDLVFAAFVNTNNTVTITDPSGYTAEFNEGNTSHEAGAAASKIAVAGDSANVAWSLTGSIIWSAAIAVWRSLDVSAPKPRPRTYSFGSQRFRGPPEPTLGRGILQPSASPTPSFSGVGDAAMSPFAASAVGLLTFTSVGDAAMQPFAADGTAATAALVTDAPWARPQPMSIGFPGPSRRPAPAFPRLGQGIQRVDPFSGYQGSASAALSPFAASASGLLTFTAAGSAAVSPFAAASAGAETFTGSGSAAVSSFACSGSGLETLTGTCSAAMSPFAVSASGAETFTGTAGAASQPFAASGSGTSLLAITGSGSVAMQPFAASGNGATGTVFTSSGSAAMSPFATSGTGSETFAGTGSAAASSFACSATGAESFTGSGSAAASSFACSGNGAQGTVFTSSGSAAMSRFAATGSSSEAFSGSASVACSPFAATSSGSLAFLGSGSAAAQSFGASGVGMVGDFIGVGAVAVSPFAASGTAEGGTVFTPPPAGGPRIALVVSSVDQRIARIPSR
jgi:hypothetical protein